MHHCENGVKIGPSANNRVAILSGLAAGTTVVTEGADGLEDGSAVSLPGAGKGGGGATGSNKRGASAKSGGN